LARQRSAPFSPLDVDAGEAPDEAPLDGAPPHANVVETTTAPRRVPCRQDALFMARRYRRLPICGSP
jgi:hypothetical protein